MKTPQLAISVIQPWAWLLTRPDIVDPKARALARAIGAIKDVENRGWQTQVRGWVWLHASATKLAKWDYQAAALFALKNGVDVPSSESVVRGAIVGAICIGDCRGFVASRWFVGEYGLMIPDSMALPEPVAMKGALKFFPVDTSQCPALTMPWGTFAEKAKLKIEEAGRGDVF